MSAEEQLPGAAAGSDPAPAFGAGRPWTELIRQAPARAGGTRVVAVDGPSGSGKSTLAAQIAAELSGPAGPSCLVVHLDDLCPGWDGLAEIAPRLLEWILRPLAAGRPARYRRYDWVLGQYTEWHQLPPSEVLVVEGVSGGARSCAPYLSLLVWVQAPLPLRFERGIARDGEAYRPHWERWARQEAALFAAERTRDRADVLVDGSAAAPVVLPGPG